MADETRQAAHLYMSEQQDSILRNSLFENVFQYSAIGMAIVSFDGRFLETNPALSQILGYSHSELMHLAIQDVTHPEDVAVSVDHIQQLIKGLIQSYSFEKRYIHKQGHVIWASLTGSLPHDSNQQPAYIIGQVQDVTARKRAEERFRALMESAPDAMMLSNEDGRIVLCNSQCERLFGYTHGELVGQPLELLVPARYRHIHPHHRNAYFEHPVRRMLGTDKELYARRKDATEFPVEISLSALETEAGKLICCAIRDVSERKQAIAVMRQREELLRQTSELANVGGWEADVVTGRAIFSEQTYKIHDLPTHVQPIMESSYQFFPPEFQPLVRKRVQQAIHEAKSWDMELPFISAAGKRRWVRVTCEPILEHGQVVKLKGIYQDITARKQQEDKLQDSLAFQQAVLNSANFAIIATDTQGLINLFNAGAEHMLGYKADEVIGKPATILLYQPVELLQQEAAWPEDGAREIDRHLNFFGVKITEAGPAQREWLYRRQNGTPVRVRVYISAINGANQTCKGYLGIAQDLNEQANQEHLVDQFITLINRLIAEPLGTIHEALELLRVDQPDLSEFEPQTALHSAQTQCQQLLEITHNLFKLTQIQRNRPIFNMRPLALGPQLEQAVQANSTYAQSQAVRLNLLKDDSDAVVVMDEEYFQQVMQTLLTHIMMSSSAGESITIKTELRSSRIRILIYREHVDDTALPYYANNNPLTLTELLNLSTESGPLLSLQISRSLIETMGGEIGHEQTPIGACLWLELPRAMQIKQAKI
jgi:PAS domain S-box-containing protein